jgi:hypothetical protein
MNRKAYPPFVTTTMAADYCGYKDTSAIQGASRGTAAAGWTARRNGPVDVGARGSRPIPARGATG